MSEEGRLTVALKFDDWPTYDGGALCTMGGRLFTPSNKVLSKFAAQGDSRAVLACLAHPNVDPTWKNNQALHRAVVNNYLDIVKMLLADPRVDVNDSKNNALTAAIRTGRSTVALYLLKHPRTNPRIHDDSLVFWAAGCDLSEVLRVLLEDPRVVVDESIIHRALGRSRRLLVAHDKWGVSTQRKLYEKYYPAVVQEYDAILSQALTMAWVAEQLIAWKDLVWPLSDRMWAFFI
jgi:hypothetical protein